jgi:hypothetical protein
MVTWFGEAAAGTSPRLQRLRTECDPEGDGVAVRLQQRDITSVMLLRPGEPPVRESRACGVADYHTNGRMLQYAMREGLLVSLVAADTSHVLALRDGLLSVAADDHITDLFITIVDDRLDIWSSTPPSRLHVQGAAVNAIGRLRLNGREMEPAHSGRLDTLVITSAHWHEPQPRADQCVA